MTKEVTLEARVSVSSVGQIYTNSEDIVKNINFLLLKPVLNGMRVWCDGDFKLENKNNICPYSRNFTVNCPFYSDSKYQIGNSIFGSCENYKNERKKVEFE